MNTSLPKALGVPITARPVRAERRAALSGLALMLALAALSVVGLSVRVGERLAVTAFWLSLASLFADALRQQVMLRADTLTRRSLFRDVEFPLRSLVRITELPRTTPCGISLDFAARGEVIVLDAWEGAAALRAALREGAPQRGYRDAGPRWTFEGPRVLARDAAVTLGLLCAVLLGLSCAVLFGVSVCLHGRMLCELILAFAPFTLWMLWIAGRSLARWRHRRSGFWCDAEGITPPGHPEVIAWSDVQSLSETSLCLARGQRTLELVGGEAEALRGVMFAVAPPAERARILGASPRARSHLIAAFLFEAAVLGGIALGHRVVPLHDGVPAELDLALGCAVICALGAVGAAVLPRRMGEG